MEGGDALPVAMTYFERFWLVFVEHLNELVPGGKNLTESILSVLDYGPRFKFDLLGATVRISDAVISMAFALIFTLVLVLWMGHKPQLKPKTGQTVAEIFFGMIDSACISMGLKPEHTARVVPFIASVGMLITLSNLSALFKLKPASVNPSFPIALGLIDLVYVVVMGIRLVGIKGFVGSLMQPAAVLLPFKILDYIIKPISLAFRLFGNIFGAYILMTFIEVLVPLVLPSVFALWFDLGDGIIQGLVFAYLTINYLGEIVEGAESAEHTRLEKSKKKAARLKLKA